MLGTSLIIRRGLQVSVAVFAINAIIGGGLYLAQGLQALVTTGAHLSIGSSDSDWLTIDYFVRALAGIWFVVGAMFMYMVPSIEKHTIWFRFACISIVFMGIGRYLSIRSFGEGNNPLIAMYLELSLPLLLMWWQSVVVRRIEENQNTLDP